MNYDRNLISKVNFNYKELADNKEQYKPTRKLQQWHIYVVCVHFKVDFMVASQRDLNDENREIALTYPGAVQR